MFPYPLQEERDCYDLDEAAHIVFCFRLPTIETFLIVCQITLIPSEMEYKNIGM